MSLFKFPAGPSGNTLPEFADYQWWFKELQDAVSTGTLDQRRALSVVRNLLDTAKVTYEKLEQVQTALEHSTHTLHTYPTGEQCKCSQCEFVRLRDEALKVKGD